MCKRLLRYFSIIFELILLPFAFGTEAVLVARKGQERIYVKSYSIEGEKIKYRECENDTKGEKEKKKFQVIDAGDVCLRFNVFAQLAYARKVITLVDHDEQISDVSVQFSKELSPELKKDFYGSLPVNRKGVSIGEGPFFSVTVVWKDNPSAYPSGIKRFGDSYFSKKTPEMNRTFLNFTTTTSQRKRLLEELKMP